MPIKIGSAIPFSTDTSRRSMPIKRTEMGEKKVYQNDVRRQLKSDPKVSLYNHQFVHFVVLAHALAAAGLTPEETRRCLSKYLRVLTPGQFGILKVHLPNVADVRQHAQNPNSETAWTNWSTSFPLRGISRLGAGNVFPAEYVKKALDKGLADINDSPKFFDGNNGWFLWAASDLSADTVYDNKTGDAVVYERFHLAELENALFVSTMVRFWAQDVTREFDAELLDSWRESSLRIFNVRMDEHLLTDEEFRQVLFNPKDEYWQSKVDDLEKTILYVLGKTGSDVTSLKPLYGKDSGRAPRRVSWNMVHWLHWAHPEFVTLYSEFGEALLKKKTLAEEKDLAKKQRMANARADNTSKPALPSKPAQAAPPKPKTPQTCQDFSWGRWVDGGPGQKGCLRN
ncbi:hypothetical protein B0T24DRAFT_617996 [Lasiosphaeria ovina]|uniref:Uncharacterized protein n=1 Tax=Lasiosphaeria ovina TaxID=92902 RepID=A0AAE0KGH4_9PEZI|nr:hypothetical protein B0T24DRAFT_617996 [Lasiosphaeria ovina]